jgi:hypothetical protein
MRILSAAVGIVLLSTASFAQPAELTDLKVTGEKALGPLKSVEGVVVGPVAGTENAPHRVTVWVNGYSTQAGIDGKFKILIPNETVGSLVGFQAGLNVIVQHDKRSLGRVKKFHALSNSPEIRDLLNKQQDVASGGGEGGIRDLLNHPKGNVDSETVTSGGGDGGIRDLLNHPKSGSDVTSGGGDGGIRDLLNKPAGNNDVTSGGGDGGIRDLLNQPPPQK